MLSWVVLALVVTTFPNHIYIMWSTFAPKHYSHTKYTFLSLYALSHLVHAHSWMNVFIYSACDPRFRKNVWKVLGKNCLPQKMLMGRSIRRHFLYASKISNVTYVQNISLHRLTVRSCNVSNTSDQQKICST